jgi:hypothetical protein
MPLGRTVPAISAIGAGAILLAMLVPGSPVVLVWPLEWLLLGAVIALGWLCWRAGRGARASCPEADRERLVLGDYARERSG